jgi:excisionase family DNA binding protein
VNTFDLDEAVASSHLHLHPEQVRPRAARGLTFPAPAVSHKAADVWVVVTLPGGGAAAFAASALAEARERALSLGLITPSGSVPETGATALPLANSTQMAELIGCNDTLVEQMAKDGRIPCVRAGKLLRFEPAAVIAALRRRSAGEAP